VGEKSRKEARADFRIQRRRARRQFARAGSAHHLMLSQTIQCDAHAPATQGYGETLGPIPERPE
jgi:hypothetical protein